MVVKVAHRSSKLRGQIFEVVMLRNGALRTKQNVSNAHEFVVC